MPIRFNADEVFQIGVEIERNGKAYYEAAAAACDSEAAKALFTELAEWESGHIAVFEKLKGELTGGSPDTAPFDPDGEAERYLKAAADSHVFGSGADPVKMAQEQASPVAALRTAMGFEKDSIVAYTAMQNLVPESMGREQITALINEELEHIFMLSERVDSLG